MKPLYYLFPALFLWSACGSGDRHTQITKPSSDSLSYHYEKYRLTSEHIVENDGKQDTTSFEANYPVFDKAEINSLIRKDLLAGSNQDSTYQSIEEEGKAFISNFDDFIEIDEYPRSWEFENHTRVIAQTSCYLATAVEWYEYSGGAHGSYGTVYYNYDLEHLDTLGLEDLIAPANQEQLRQIGEKIFRKQEQLEPADGLENYFFEDDVFNLNRNFTLTSDGLLFLYNIYEIKPYVSGTTALLLPYEEIQPLLTETGKAIQVQLSKKRKKVNASI